MTHPYGCGQVLELVSGARRDTPECVALTRRADLLDRHGALSTEYPQERFAGPAVRPGRGTPSTGRAGLVFDYPQEPGDSDG